MYINWFCSATSSFLCLTLLCVCCFNWQEPPLKETLHGLITHRHKVPSIGSQRNTFSKLMAVTCCKCNRTLTLYFLIFLPLKYSEHQIISKIRISFCFLELFFFFPPPACCLLLSPPPPLIACDLLFSHAGRVWIPGREGGQGRARMYFPEMTFSRLSCSALINRRSSSCRVSKVRRGPLGWKDKKWVAPAGGVIYDYYLCLCRPRFG